MSHFTVLVVTKNGTDEELTNALQPFHEFECTGIDDEYIQDIDITERVREEWQSTTATRLRAPDGSIYCPYDDRFYRDPTDDEASQIGPFIGTGISGGTSFKSKDWGDGLGCRARVLFKPDDHEEISLPYSEIKSFVDFCADYCGGEVVAYGDEPDLSSASKYGYVVLDESGDVLRVIDRTNPNFEWDGWVVGGRWSGTLRTKGGESVDSAKKSEVAFDVMLVEKQREFEADYELAIGATGNAEWKSWSQTREETGDILQARSAYNEQAAVKAIRAAFPDRFLLDPDEFLAPKDEYIRAHATFSTFAFLGLDRKWIERGDMGWFGVISDEKDKSNWAEQFSSLLNAVSDDCYLTVVDCHI